MTERRMMMDEKRIMGVLQRVADENGVSLDTVLEEIEQIIDVGKQSRDPLIRSRWEAMTRRGRQPTVTELMRYLIEQVESDANFQIK